MQVLGSVRHISANIFGFLTKFLENLSVSGRNREVCKQMFCKIFKLVSDFRRSLEYLDVSKRIIKSKEPFCEMFKFASDFSRSLKVFRNPRRILESLKRLLQEFASLLGFWAYPLGNLGFLNESANFYRAFYNDININP